MGQRSRYRETRNGCLVASQGIQAVLDVEVAKQRATESRFGSALAHSPHGKRKRLGCSAYSWGLLKLGFDVSERTVSRYMPRRKPKPDEIKRWMAFLRNHREVIAAMDFFTVPTATFRISYGFFIIHHHQRKILHFNATLNPSAEWVAQPLREAFPYSTAPRYLIFDRDTCRTNKSPPGRSTRCRFFAREYVHFFGLSTYFEEESTKPETRRLTLVHAG